MAIKVVSWNIEGRLTRFAKKGRGTPEHIVREIKKLDGDVVFLAEASDGDTVEPDITARLTRLGYQVRTVDYGETGKDRRWAAEAAPTMKLLTRVPVTDFRQIRLGGTRNALIAEVQDRASGQTLRVFGIHLDDRNEAYRLKQLDDLLPVLGESRLPTVLMGDLNAMHADSLPARIFSSGFIATVEKYWPHARTKDGWQRLIEMAKGDTLKRFEQAGMRDADPGYGPTETPKMRFQEWMPSVRIAQIDHIFVSPGLKVKGFHISRDGGSDHRAISATVNV